MTSSQKKSLQKTSLTYQSGPIKIKDGLYMGDQLSAKDFDFLTSNKVTHIINTVVQSIPNIYQPNGIDYLSVNWTQTQSNIFDKKNKGITMIYNFIQQAMIQGQSVLVHSINGKSRAGSVILAYLIKKYSWSLNKSLDFVLCKFHSFQIKEIFLNQLKQLQHRLSQSYQLSSHWNSPQSQQDTTITNTYKNTKPLHQSSQHPPLSSTKQKTHKKLSWSKQLVTSIHTKPPSNILTTMTKYTSFVGQSEKQLISILKSDKVDKGDKGEKKYGDKLSYFQFNNLYKFTEQTISPPPILPEQLNRPQKSYNIPINNYLTPTTTTTDPTRNASARSMNTPTRNPQNHQLTQRANLTTISPKTNTKLPSHQLTPPLTKSPHDANLISKISIDKSKIHKKTMSQDRDYSAHKKPGNPYLMQLDKPYLEKRAVICDQTSSTKKKYEVKPIKLPNTTKQDTSYKNKYSQYSQRETIFSYK